MKNIDKKSTKYLVLILIIYVLMGLILYPLLDFIYCKLITKSEFVYSIQAYVIKPIVVCLVMGIISWLIGKK